MLGRLSRLLAASLLLCGLAGRAPAQEEGADAEIEALRHAAEVEAAQEAGPQEEVTETTFKSGGLGLQALNPEVSVAGDFLAGSGLPVAHDHDGHHHEGEPTDWDFNFRGLGLHFESYLDPYSRFKAAIHAAPPPHGVEMEEAYFTRYGALAGGNLTLGKFRQQFGVVNRWHKHALDYVDFPMPLMKMLGHHGLCQTGMSLDWTGSIGSTSQELTLQVTDGENETMFRGNSENRPSVLAHYKLNYDVSASTYFEVGLTGLVGWNHEWPLDTDPISHAEDTRSAQVYGLDFALLWEPTHRMRYRNVEWRTELYYVSKDIVAPDGSGDGTLNPWGAYTSLQTKVSRTVDVGFRFDYFSPEAVDYTLVNQDLHDLMPPSLVAEEDGAHRWLGAVYVTWWQSPFVKFRLQYDHEDGEGTGDPVDRVVFQCVYAAGPHKHERY